MCATKFQDRWVLFQVQIVSRNSTSGLAVVGLTFFRNIFQPIKSVGAIAVNDDRFEPVTRCRWSIDHIPVMT